MTDQTGALTIAQFGHNYKLGRTKIYEEIKTGRLEARKIGSKTLIPHAAAERWFRSLPKLGIAP